MTEAKKINRAIRLYPLYEAASGDLLFYSVIEILFLTMVKGFSIQQVAEIVFITDLADLLLEYPTYRHIRKIGNSRAIMIGGILPVISIMMITAGWTLPPVILGKILFAASFNYQSMAGAGARNNLVLAGKKDQYAGLFSRANVIYAAVSMVSATIIPFVFARSRFLPSLLCLALYAGVAVIAFLIPDYTEGMDLPSEGKKRKEASGKIGRGMFLLLIVFCGFFCAGGVFRSNTELFLSGHILEMLSEDEMVFVYGGIIWASKVIKLGSSVILPQMLDRLREGIVVFSSLSLFLAFLVIGCSGILFRQTWIPVLTAGAAYIVVRGIFWEPLRAYLRMTAADTNSKRKQQTILTALNAGQSIVKLLMDLIVVGILKIFSLEYVFLVFAAVSAALVLCSIRLKNLLARNLEIMRFEAVLGPETVDQLSQIIYERLLDAGMDHKEAVSYRLLTEEKLLECLKNGKESRKFCLVLSKRLDSFFVDLAVDGEKSDVFELPLTGDDTARDIFFHIVKDL